MQIYVFLPISLQILNEPPAFRTSKRALELHHHGQLSQCVFMRSRPGFVVLIQALVFGHSTEGALVPVDVGRWIDELRSGNFGEYVEKQKRFVQKERASIAQGVMIDGLTAVFLLNGESVTSTTGKDVVSFYRGQFINFEESNISLPQFFSWFRYCRAYAAFCYRPQISKQLLRRWWGLLARSGLPVLGRGVFLRTRWAMRKLLTTIMFEEYSITSNVRNLRSAKWASGSEIKRFSKLAMRATKRFALIVALFANTCGCGFLCVRADAKPQVKNWSKQKYRDFQQFQRLGVFRPKDSKGFCEQRIKDTFCVFLCRRPSTKQR